MPTPFQEEYAALKTKVSDLEKEIGRITQLLRHVKGDPVIQGYAQKILTLNDNLNVIDLLNRIDSSSTAFVEDGVFYFPINGNRNAEGAWKLLLDEDAGKLKFYKVERSIWVLKADLG